MANARLRRFVEAHPNKFRGSRYARLRKALGVAIDAPSATEVAPTAEKAEPQPAATPAPHEAKPATKAELAEEYERLTGETPNSRWLKAELEQEVNQARSRYRRRDMRAGE